MNLTHLRGVVAQACRRVQRTACTSHLASSLQTWILGASPFASVVGSSACTVSMDCSFSRGSDPRSSTNQGFDALPTLVLSKLVLPVQANTFDKVQRSSTPSEGQSRNSVPKPRHPQIVPRPSSSRLESAIWALGENDPQSFSSGETTPLDCVVGRERDEAGRQSPVLWRSRKKSWQQLFFREKVKSTSFKPGLDEILQHHPRLHFSCWNWTGSVAVESSSRSWRHCT